MARAERRDKGERAALFDASTVDGATGDFDARLQTSYPSINIAVPVYQNDRAVH